MDNKLKKVIEYAILVLVSLMLFFYGMYFNVISNYYIMALAVLFIIYRSITVGKLRFDINMCFLMETFFVKAVLDQQIGKADIVPSTIAMPVLLYLLGKLLFANTNSFAKGKSVIALVALSLGTGIHGYLTYSISKRSGLLGMDLYVEFADKSIAITSLTYYFYYMFIAAFVVAAVIYEIYRITGKSDNAKVLSRIVGIVVLATTAIVAVIKYTQTERFLALKEGIGLITTKYWGNFGLDLTYNNSTSNMWLDYGRDYGILVFVTLFIFFLLTIKDAVILAVNKNVNVFIKAALLALFILTNIYYFIDSSAYVFPSYWYVGLIICGAVNEVAHFKETRVDN